MKKLLLVILVVAAASGLLLAASLYTAAARWHSPHATEVDLPPGTSVRGIANRLAEAGVIRAPTLFAAIVRVKGSGKSLRAGLYDFPAGTTMLAAIERIERGDVRQWPFTVIEGWTAKEIAAALRGQPFLKEDSTPDEFLRLVSDPQFVAEMGVTSAASLEGYLFPDTYFLMKPTSAETLVKRMVTRFGEVWRSLGVKPGGKNGLSSEEIVTLASIVEKETGVDAERPLIASVFFNRLRIGMPLQSDPTIIYGLPNFDGNIRKSDITNPHRYNTYVHSGLPPGPICNPGRAAISAVLDPERSDYLYFVSKRDGSHQFSRTLSDHNQAVHRYQLMRKNP